MGKREQRGARISYNISVEFTKYSLVLSTPKSAALMKPG